MPLIGSRSRDRRASQFLLSRSKNIELVGTGGASELHFSLNCSIAGVSMEYMDHPEPVFSVEDDHIYFNVCVEPSGCLGCPARNLRSDH